MIVGCVGYPPATILDYVYSCLLALVVLLPLCFYFLIWRNSTKQPAPKSSEGKLKRNTTEE